MVAAVGRAEPGDDRATAELLVAATGPDSRDRRREIGRALRGERVTFGTVLDGRRVDCTAEPMSVTGGSATHLLVMVYDCPGADTTGDSGPGPVRDRGAHLDESSFTLTGRVASAYAAGIPVSGVWPPRTRDPIG